MKTMRVLLSTLPLSRGVAARARRTSARALRRGALAAKSAKRGRNTKPPIGLDVPHALPPAGVRGVAGVTKAEKTMQLP